MNISPELKKIQSKKREETCWEEWKEVDKPWIATKQGQYIGDQALSCSFGLAKASCSIYYVFYVSFLHQ
jgi:hypothetical protein